MRQGENTQTVVLSWQGLGEMRTVAGAGAGEEEAGAVWSLICWDWEWKRNHLFFPLTHQMHGDKIAQFLPYDFSK